MANRATNPMYTAASTADHGRRVTIDDQPALSASAADRLAAVGLNLLMKFDQRLPDNVRDESGALIRSPHQTDAGEPTVMDLVRMVRALRDMGWIGNPHESEADEQRVGLEVLRQQVAEMYAREDWEADA